MGKRFIGLDYGKKKVGVAVSYGGISEPYRVMKYRKSDELLRKIKAVICNLDVNNIVLGISEGRMAEDTKKFGKMLEEELAIPVTYQDETLTTKDAQRLSIEAGIKRKKRKALEDAYSAALILQSFLDNH